MHFVASLLQDSDLPDDALIATLDISTPALTFETDINTSDDFLPTSKEFLMRDRAFSWDIRLEEEVHANLIAVDNTKTGKAYIKCEGPPNKKARKYEVSSRKSEQRTKRQQDESIKTEVKEEQNVSLKRSMEGDLQEPDSLHKIVFQRTLTTPDVIATVVTTVDVIVPQPIPVPIMLVATSPELETPDSINTDSVVLIGAYTKEQRRERIDRFRAKKKRRVWRKQIKYDCRKRLADTRPRVKGRFVSRKEGPGDDVEGDVDVDSTSLAEGDSLETDGIEVDHLPEECTSELMAQDCEEVSHLLM